MDALMDLAQPAAGRGADGRFQPGHSGNPAGKPKSTRHRLTVLRKLLAEGESETAGRRFIERALAGEDKRAEILLVQPVFPKPRGRTIALDLPEAASAADDLAFLDAAMAGLANGGITIDEALALALARLVELRRKLREGTAAAARLAGFTVLLAGAAPPPADPLAALLAPPRPSSLRRELLNSTCIGGSGPRQAFLLPEAA